MKTAIKKTEVRRNPHTTIIATMQAPIEQAFDYIAPIYLPHIFPGTGPIAGIAGTSVDAGWNKAGLSRTIYFTDGTTTKETMLQWNAPTHFAYKNEEFTSPALKYTAIRVEGEWFFTRLDDNTTKIEWTYRAIPKNFLAKFFIRYVLMRFITRMLQQAMDIAKHDLETGDLAGAQFPPVPVSTIE
ncbi:SRPBCC family protein [Olivibacter sp. XZL3]|uniref:SRPBCC family protein n=1 Tax=Olivibacter sp. XZL3 TaxID=1735116 RepID=UPI001064C66D|nr:SRPBCC family protein [Olivibacter sp. XZL3]